MSKVTELFHLDFKMADPFTKFMSGVHNIKPERYELSDSVSRPYSPPAVPAEPLVLPTRVSQFHLLQKVNETEEVALAATESNNNDGVVKTGPMRRVMSSPMLFTSHHQVEPKKKISAEAFKQSLLSQSPPKSPFHMVKKHSNLDGEGYTSALNKQSAAHELQQFSLSSKSLPVSRRASATLATKGLTSGVGVDTERLVSKSLELKNTRIPVSDNRPSSASPRGGFFNFFSPRSRNFDSIDGAAPASDRPGGAGMSGEKILPEKIFIRSKDLNVFAPGPL